MKIKYFINQDIVNYKKVSMFIGTSFCDFKCCKQIGEDICLCQNSQISKSEWVQVPNDNIINQYLNNPLSESIVFGGLQPMLQFEEVYDIISKLRKHVDDVIVIYTGYYKEQIEDKIERLKQFKNIIVKFGRFIPNGEKHYDQILGVYLANKQQYAEKIS